MTMSDMEHIPTRLHYGVVCRPKVSRAVSGDAYLIQETGQAALVAVIDGLGSGEAAAQAAIRAREQIQSRIDAPLGDIFQACHQALHNTRGVVMGILRIDFEVGESAFAGVGNVSIHVQSAVSDVKPISRNGIVGHRLPQIREFRYPYTPGDLFALHSDGISSRFTLSGYRLILPDEDLQQVAQQIARDFGKDEDDVTLVLAR